MYFQLAESSTGGIGVATRSGHGMLHTSYWKTDQTLKLRTQKPRSCCSFFLRVFLLILRSHISPLAVFASRIGISVLPRVVLFIHDVNFSHYCIIKVLWHQGKRNTCFIRNGMVMCQRSIPAINPRR